MEHSVIRPAEGADASIVLPPVLSYIVGAPAAPRAAVEALIEAAILALDTLDGDPDREDDDPAGQYDEDFYTAPLPRHSWYGPGCPISDNDFEHDGREDEYDVEVQQLPNDVPMLPAVNLEGEFVGIVNLQSSFRTNGSRVLSADSGRMFRARMDGSHRRGVPV